MALEIVRLARHIQIETLHDGDGMGWSSLLSDEPKHLHAWALTEVRALAFSGKDLRQAFEQDPKFGYALMRRLLTIAVERLDATPIPARESIFDATVSVSHTSRT